MAVGQLAVEQRMKKKGKKKKLGREFAIGDYLAYLSRFAPNNLQQQKRCLGTNGEGRTIKILKVGELDPLPHAQHVTRGTQAVDQDPDIPGVQRAQCLRLLRAAVAIRADGRADVRPRGNDTRHHHETEREQRHGADRAAKPQHLAVGDQDDCQVLEDGVDGDAEELEGLGRGVDHGDEQQRDGEPFARLVDVEVAICYNFCRFAELDSDDADDVLFGKSAGSSEERERRGEEEREERGGEGG